MNYTSDQDLYSKIIENFLGSKIIKMPSENVSFVSNNNQDTLIVKMNENIGSSWSFNMSGTAYTVTYKSKQIETVLINIQDSIKTFIVTSNDFTDSIKISKQYGITHGFTILTDYNNRKSSLGFDLQYIPNLKKGKNRLNYLSYFQFEVGDVMSYTTNAPNTWPGYDPSIPTVIYNILSKIVSPLGDSITYIINTYPIYPIPLIGIPSNNNPKNYTVGTASKTTFIVTENNVYNIFYPCINDLQLTSQTNNYPLNSNLMAYQYEVDTLNINLYLQNPVAPFEESTKIHFSNKGLVNFTHERAFTDFNNYFILIDYKTMFSTSDTLDISSVLSVKSSTQALTTQIYPNPFNDKVIIKSGQIEKDVYTLHIYDLQGKEVYSTSNINTSNQEILLDDLSFLTSGMYLIKLQGERNTYSSQIIKR
jgi:hypothetical protein